MPPSSPTHDPYRPMHSLRSAPDHPMLSSSYALATQSPLSSYTFPMQSPLTSYALLAPRGSCMRPLLLPYA